MFRHLSVIWHAGTTEMFGAAFGPWHKWCFLERSRPHNRQSRNWATCPVCTMIFRSAELRLADHDVEFKVKSA